MDLVSSPTKIPPALLIPVTTCSSYNTNNHRNSSKLILPNTALTNLTISSSASIATSFIHVSNPNAWSGTSRAATPSPPSPPDPDKLPTPPPGVPMTLSRFKDVAQVFVGVLFWMAVFFWASAWDGRDKPDKGSRFRR
ncbi:hypothetical protein ACET3Z_026707 [Daucus carota]|uniref:Uncharacterized protein n=1 Tax=Daucus carota subsp. sativus TaxID=79200 RepID=A0A164U4W3_DAUCS|nr:PREDICTED: uncharacterized protein LOC108195230 [Daucus carota subsp. sativus]